MNAMNWMDLLSNPRGAAVKNYMLQLLGAEKYQKHQSFIERLAVNLQTQSDLEDFANIMVSIFESGYFKALNDYKDKFEKLGYNITVSRETVAENR
jgi:hypothetical protein